MQNFNLICIEGADKCGKTTLSTELRNKLDNVRYCHFTACNKKEYSPTDFALQRNVNVLYQFFAYFRQHFFNNSKPEHTYVLDRTLYSDIIYGPIYRGTGDELVVRSIEKNYFTLLLQTLNCIFIFADNKREDDGYKNIVEENEGMIKSAKEYTDLRSAYRNLLNDIKCKSDLNFLHYDFNKTDAEKFVQTVIPTMMHRVNSNKLFNKLIEYSIPHGEFIGTLDIDENTPIYNISKPSNTPITIQDYAELVMSTGCFNYSKDSPLMNHNKFCIVESNSRAEEIIKEHIKELNQI